MSENSGGPILITFPDQKRPPWILEGFYLASSSFNRHMKDKHGKSEECEICKKRFLTLSGLESHQRKAHVVNIISYFECHFCDYKSMNKYYMTDHVRRQHAGEGSNSFVCNKCYTRKQNEHILMKHMQQHQEFNCVVCGKKFNSSKNLKRHGKVHEIKRCQECGKNFNSNKDLTCTKKSTERRELIWRRNTSLTILRMRSL